MKIRGFLDDKPERAAELVKIYDGRAYDSLESALNDETRGSMR